MVPVANQSHGEYDFNLHRKDGTVTAVEVTSATDRQEKHANAVLEELNHSIEDGLFERLAHSLQRRCPG